MLSLVTAMVVSVVAALMVSAACLYLSAIGHMRALRFWAIAFISNAVRYIFSLAVVVGELWLIIPVVCYWFGSRMELQRPLHLPLLGMIVAGLLSWILISPALM